MTPSQVFSQSRVILNDPAGGTPRWSDADLLTYYNDYRKALARAKGELFTELSTLNMVEGEVQTVDRKTTFGLVDVLKNTSGDAVRGPIDRNSLELSLRTWRKSTPAPMREWARINQVDPFRFLCYPPAAAGDTAQVMVISIPQDILIASIGADDGISDAYRNSAATFVAGMALTVNTNAADTQKGLALISSAMTLAGASTGG